MAPVFVKRSTNYQPNLFTESKQEFTELEKKIVVLVVNQIGYLAVRGELNPRSNITVTIPFSTLTRDHHQQIADAAESLQSKRLVYRDDTRDKFDFITPFPRVRSELVDGKRVIEITMFSDMVPHFAELGQRYTKYDIDVMLSLGSVYAQRMFEIVSMYQNRKQFNFTYEVDQLMMMLNCPKGYSFHDFKKNALVIAQRELKRKADLLFDWKPSKKNGKRIIALEFTIKTANQLVHEAIENDRRTINEMPLHEAVRTAWKLLDNYKLKNWQKDLIATDYELLEIFFRVDAELANGLRPTVKNHTAYLVKSLGMDQMKSPESDKPRSNKKSSSHQSILPLGPEVRTGSVQSIGSILGGIPFSESKDEQ
ncbi:MAG: replication initiation protein [Bacteroidetes bacterium]|nr:replication initiation protein [Bacteroidota bacterium]